MYMQGFYKQYLFLTSGIRKIWILRIWRMLTNKPSMFNKQANVKSVRKVYVNIENDDVYLIWWGFDEKFEI